MAKGRWKGKKQAFYERGAPTGQSGGEGSGNGGSEGDELRRQFRELLRRQPDDVGLVLKASRVLPKKPAGTKAEETAAAMKRALDMLGDQLFPGGRP